MRVPRFPVAIRRGSVVTRVYRFARADGRVVFTASWNVGGVRHSRQFAGYAAAHAEASMKADQLAAGKLGSAATLNADDGAVLLEARKLCGGVPFLAALQEWAAARELTHGNIIPAAEAWKARNAAKVPRVKVASVVDEFCKAKTKAGFAVASNHASEFSAIKTQFGEQCISEVSAKAMDAWLAKWAGASTRNTYRRRLSAVWRWAQQRGYLPSDLKTQAERTERAREEAAAVGIISVETWRRILDLMRGQHSELLATATVAGFCGLRRTEVQGQTWEDINLEQRFLRVTKVKRGTPSRRLVPLSSAAVKWLMLCNERQGQIGPALCFDKLRRICREAKPKIDLPENCFRHSFISHRVADTGNIPETSLEAGNSPKIINAHYRELVTKEAGRAWFSIEPNAAAAVVRMDGESAAIA